MIALLWLLLQLPGDEIFVRPRDDRAGHDAPVPEPAPCVWLEGYAEPDPDDELDRINLWLEDGTSRTLWPNHGRRVAHADDPHRTPEPGREATYRTVRYCDTHGEVLVLGGMPPRDFSFAGSVESWVDEAVGPSSMSYERALVAKGLASRSYATRECAARILAGRGVASIVALRRGLDSPDAEVRIRSALILAEIRNGPHDRRPGATR